MNKWQKDVLEFHEKFDSAIGDYPKIRTGHLRKELLKEEVAEFCEAVDQDDIVEAADAIADIIYVALGAAVAFGIDMGAVWDEVHRSNMDKTGGGVNEIHKILKPAGWIPPNIAAILAAQKGTNQW